MEMRNLDVTQPIAPGHKITSLKLLIDIKDGNGDFIEPADNINSSLSPFIKKAYRKDFVCLDIDFSKRFEALTEAQVCRQAFI